MTLVESPTQAAYDLFRQATELNNAGCQDEALCLLRKAIDFFPDFQQACVNLAAILICRERHDEALPWCERALRLDSNCKVALFNRGRIHQRRAELDSAIRCYTRALEIAPYFAAARWNRACCLLLAGRFHAGWQDYEWRARAGEVVIDPYPQPRWDGSWLEDRKLLVHAEQGIGDEILFASCLQEAIERVDECVILCDPRLARLFERSFPEATVQGYVRRKDRQPAQISERVDVQIPAGSLPGMFRNSPRDFPKRQSFLKADRMAVQKWRQRLVQLGPGLKVGISWQAGGQPAERRKRSTGLTQWREILSMPGVHFVNLQYGETNDDLTTVQSDLGIAIHDWDDGDPLVDLDDFAAKLSALDLVISVGNATVHLAGALGARTWALLPFVPNWRWMIAGEESHWYSSVKLFRQSNWDCWDDVFERVSTSLGQLMGTHVPRKFATQNQPIQAPRPKAEQISNGLPASRTFDVAMAFSRASESFRTGAIAEAEQICRTILDHSPRHAPAWNLLGVLQRQSGRMDLAIKSFARAVSVVDTAPGYHYNLADALRENGRLSDAATSLRQVIQLKPDFAKAHNALGAVLLSLERRDEAIDCFRRAIDTQPDYVAAINNLGRALQESGSSEQARDCYQRALRIDPACPQVHFNLASLSNVITGG